MDVVEEFVFGNFEFLGDELIDSEIRLVKKEEIDIVVRDSFRDQFENDEKIGD